MIASLRGIVQAWGDDELILDVGGVGLRVSVPLSRLEKVPRVGKTIFLHTQLVVREDSLALYGFGAPEERDLFGLLLQVSGIGPRLALAALSHMAPEALRRAVTHDQPDILARVPGIGRKTAERIIFHLKDKLGEPGPEVPEPSEIDTEVLGVLTNLGYSLVEAQAAVQSIPEDTPEEIEARVRVALRYFATP